ncbi:MAG: GTPase HflX, partial [Betaproteobacteria bacterium]|nr:GTPase HflX [Betaproteobacteria bacterium]
MSERPAGRANAAVLVGLDFGADGYAESVDELRLLVESAGLAPAALIQGKRQRPDPALYAGSGKTEEIAAAVQEHKAVVVVFNHELSPAQQRNLEQKLDCPVLDRSGLILGIFARRARSNEGKLQVELAQLEYASTRLVRGWTHLERQRGGRGFMGGMGETQIEIDRRLLAKRVKL